MRVTTLAAGITAAVLLGTAAQAADLIVEPDVPAIEAATFDWEGPYAGVQAFVAGDEEYSFVGAGGVVGINFLASESVLIGVEASAALEADDDYSYGEALLSGRAGFLVTPTVLLYAIGSVGAVWGLGDASEYSDLLYELGGGVEVAVSDSMSVKAQVTGRGYGDSDSFDLIYGKATVGLNFHF